MENLSKTVKHSQFPGYGVREEKTGEARWGFVRYLWIAVLLLERNQFPTYQNLETLNHRTSKSQSNDAELSDLMKLAKSYRNARFLLFSLCPEHLRELGRRSRTVTMGGCEPWLIPMLLDLHSFEHQLEIDRILSLAQLGAMKIYWNK